MGGSRKEEGRGWDGMDYGIYCYIANLAKMCKLKTCSLDSIECLALLKNPNLNCKSRMICMCGPSFRSGANPHERGSGWI